MNLHRVNHCIVKKKKWYFVTIIVLTNCSSVRNKNLENITNSQPYGLEFANFFLNFFPDTKTFFFSQYIRTIMVTKYHFFSKHQNKVEFKNLDDSEVLSSDFPGPKTSAASLTSSASATSLASTASKALFHQRTS